MAVITISDNLPCEQFSWGQSRNTITFKSAFGSQSVDIRNPWWTATLSAPRGYESDSGNWQTLLMSLGGATNQLAMHNLARPVPIGTLRGNMTFASYAPAGATTINISSLVGGINSLTFPEDFSNAVWSKSNCTVAANTTISPDGTTTADTITSLSATSLTGISYGITTTNTTYTHSLFVSSSSYRYIQMLWSGSLSSDYVNFDLITKTVTGGVYSSASIVQISPTWFRIALTSNTLAATGALYCIMIPNAVVARNPTWTPTAGLTTVIWGAKLETGSVATDYGYGKTLLKGDYIGFGSGVTQQVVMVISDAISTSQGSITFSVQPPLRNAFTASSPVVWDKPKVLFRQQETDCSWDYDSTLSSGYKMSLLEDPRP